MHVEYKWIDWTCIMVENWVFCGKDAMMGGYE